MQADTSVPEGWSSRVPLVQVIIGSTRPARTLRAHPTELIARFGRVIDRADGYLIITAEYNHGHPASLKNAMDHLFPEFNRKPVAYLGYGSVGGARAIEQLRLVAVELELAPLRHAVHILPELMVPAMRAEVFDPAVYAPLDQRLNRAVSDLVWWARVLAAARATPDGHGHVPSVQSTAKGSMT
jgi:NAD(P)H-dependent FMN reductase